MSTKISWQVDIKGASELIKTFENVDKSIFNDREFANTIWNAVFKKISSFIQKRFEEGKSSWKPLDKKYLKWKVSAARRGVQVPVGSFGKRVCKLTAIGRLTDTMYPSATEKRFANIFEIGNSQGFNGGSFRYAIDGNKMPYAKYFDNKREFFYITDTEAEEVFKTIENKISRKIISIW